ncbi:MAG: phosphatidylserine decarboxylase [Phascolarctobacterium sp.]|nr:phosphatidylserine decarboxylase [Phascolarctobacterium sp.]
MFVVKDGYIYVGVCLVLTALVAWLAGIYWAVIPFVLGLYFAYFFRDEHREVIYDDGILYSAADATVVAIEELYEDEFLMCDCVKITTFLSVFNVHVNRSPMKGEVKYQKYTVGEFVPAYDSDAGARNERFAIGLDNGKYKILVIQVAGLLARRISNWVSLGHQMEQGERYGMIKFGSSTEVYVPKDIFEPCVKVGQSVVGGVTVLGRIKA